MRCKKMVMILERLSKRVTFLIVFTVFVCIIAGGVVTGCTVTGGAVTDHAGDNQVERDVNTVSALEIAERFETSAIIKSVALFGVTAAEIANEPAVINLLFTSDLHSHFDSFEEAGKLIGGYARLKTLIDENMGEKGNDILVDCGDFTTGLSVTGTPYSKFYCTDAAELRMLGRLGIQYTTFGNHELDFNLKGLEQMANAAEASGDVLPELLVCNIDWAATEKIYPGLKDKFEGIGQKPYQITEIAGKKVAIIGVIGQDAINWASDYNDMIFKNPIEAVRGTVDKIKSDSDVDMIVLLAHCGTNRALLGVVNNDEVKAIIDAVPELDVVVCGHTHMAFDEPIIYKDTPMIACGNYGRNLGKVVLQEDEDGHGWNILKYELIPVTDSVAEDEEVVKVIEGDRKTVR